MLNVTVIETSKDSEIVFYIYFHIKDYSKSKQLLKLNCLLEKFHFVDFTPTIDKEPKNKALPKKCFVFGAANRI